MNEQTQSNITQAIDEIIERTLFCQPKDIQLNTHFVEDLFADSIMFAELIMDINEHFSISLLDNDIQKCNTVGDLYQIVCANLKKEMK